MRTLVEECDAVRMMIRQQTRKSAELEKMARNAQTSELRRRAGRALAELAKKAAFEKERNAFEAEWKAKRANQSSS